MNKSKFKILLTEDDPNIRQIYSVIIEDRYDIPIVEAESGKQAIYFLKNDPHIKMIISDFHMPNGNGGELYSFNIQNKNLPFLLCSSDSTKDHQVFSSFFEDNSFNLDLGKTFDHEKLYSAISKIYKKATGEKLKRLGTEEETYYRIKISRYPQLKKLNCNVYLKVENENYMKILSIGNQMSEETFKSYTDMMVNYFYIDRDGLEVYLKSTFENYAKNLKNNQLRFDEKIEVQKESIFELQDVVTSIGISDFVIDFTDQVINSITLTVISNNNLYNYIKNVINNDSYIQNHTMLMNYISSALIHQMDEVDNAIIDRFIYASLFCNIGLKNKNLASIQGRNNFNFKDLAESEKIDVLNHPALSAEILKSEKKDLNDVRIMIKGHHAIPDQNHTLFQAIFMLVHDFSHNIITQNATSKKKLQTILSSMRKTHTVGQFERPYLVLTEMIRKKPKER